VLDVLIVGGGQAGLAAAFGLLQARVTNILVIDENCEGDEGPWGTYARMRILRTKKEVGGIDLGVASLSLRAWYEAQFGAKAWRDLYKMPTALWHRYLKWYRDVLGIPVRNACRMIGFGPASQNGLLEVNVESHGCETRILTRTLVLATGAEGNGTRRIPHEVSENIQRKFWAHAQEMIDFDSLRGKRVAVLGGGASAFDNAIAAAEHGSDVHIFHRRPVLQAAFALAWGEFNGYLAHFADLEPLERWRFVRQMRRIKNGPPVATMARAAGLPNITIHPGTTWNGIAQGEGRIRIDASDRSIDVDFIILGTGYELRVEARAEMASVLPFATRWRDVFTPPAGEEDSGLLGAFFLGPNFEMQEKDPGAAPWLKSVFNFCHGSSLSMGPLATGLTGIKFGAPRLVHGVTRRLFCTDAYSLLQGMAAWQQSSDVYEP
jgi:cation diffusion facilitator CzcD-associated flavoprotein CzcO